MTKKTTPSTGSEQHAQSAKSIESNQRRKAVRNILAGSGLTLGAATAGSWVKPMVNAVVLPSHAQMSAPMSVVLAGNASIGPTAGIDADKLPGSSSVLDFFIGPANAGVDNDLINLSGACMIMTVPGDGTFSMNVEFVADPPIIVSGAVSGAMINGSGGGLSVTGSIDLAAATPRAMGNISNGSDIHSFSIDGATTACTPIGTTAAPTTTSSPTTSSPTTSPPTTSSPTTSPPTTSPPTTSPPIMTTIPPFPF